MEMVCLDYETYFDTKAGYTLKKMTMEAYVRDPRFTVICLGYDDGYGKRGWVKAADIPAFLARFDWSKATALCHNSNFDGIILSHHYNVRPAAFACTLAMAHELYPGQDASLEGLAEKFGLDAKSVPYKLMDGVHPRDMSGNLLAAAGAGAEHDCALTRPLYDRMLADGFPVSELPIVSMTAEMFTNPKLVGDANMLRSLQQAELDKRQELFDKLGVTAKDLGSPTKFRALLEAHGVEIEFKTGTNGPIPAFAATDPFMQELQGNENPVIAQLAEARILTKSNIRATRAGRLADTADRGAMPVFLYYFGAARTGRWSGGDKSNWQNFPRTGELSKCISAPAGYVLVICDASQIEYRILCAVAGEQWPLDVFREGKTDPYCEVASGIFGRPITKADEDQRFFGKKVVLSSGYGIGWLMLFKRLRGEGVKLTEEMAQQAVDTYRARHPRVVELWREADKVLYCLNTKRSETWKEGILKTDNGSLVLPNGCRLQYRLRWDRDERQYYRFDRRSGKDGSRIWGSALVGETIQALASVYLRGVLIRIKDLTGLKPVCLRHDEAVYVVPEDQGDLIKHVVEKEFCRPPDWLPDIPLGAECWASKTYTKA